MLLTISTTRPSATDLGFLLHKHPERVQPFDLPFGRCVVFYPEATEARCTAALLLELDPVGLVRRTAGDAPLAAYVNDRPYVASSFLSVAMAHVFGTAMAGRSRERPDLAAEALPLEARVSVVPAYGGEAALRGLFEPLGYAVTAEPVVLDAQFPEWGESRYWRLSLAGTVRLRDLLSHLYVLLPVLDGAKHYFVGDDEVAKLLARGEGWLPDHPQRNRIAWRYLRRQRSLTRQAVERLVMAESPPEPDGPDEPDELDEPDAGSDAAPETAGPPERPMALNQQRIGAVVAALKASGATRVLDLGCGEGRLLRALLQDQQFTELLGVDVSVRKLETAARRLRLDRLPPRQRERIRLLHGSLTYRDDRLTGYSAAAIVEVVEHFDPPRLAAFERVVFGVARPHTVVLTTPNRDHNVRYEILQPGGLRHPDHRFEWTRAEFADWVRRVAAEHGYRVRIEPVGEVDAEVGSPTQMAVFEQEPGADE